MNIYHETKRPISVSKLIRFLEENGNLSALLHLSKLKNEIIS